MNLVKLHVDSFIAAGISARTTNAQEMTTSAQIPKLWQRLTSENFLARIPDRVDDHVIALYTGYESDKNGPYTFILGAKVSSKKNLPPEFVAREVASGQYAMFTEQGGPPPEMTVNLWKRIWSLEKPGTLERAYKTDYEVHYSPANDVAKSRVDIYIGLLGKK
ncbi:MAG TPA: GyrI-like domain-containing protein [Bryobacteraceae bacterium]|nr:GyrI-like domain-containing protein [Bryobacteraceae bacterium]